MAKSITGSTLAPHIGHTTEIKYDKDNISIYCNECNVMVWETNVSEERAHRRKLHKERLARMKVEEPERYKELNRRKSAKHRERAKSDPERYAQYLAKAKEYNDRARAKKEVK